MWHYRIILSNCDCFVDDDNDLYIYVDNVLVWTEKGCGFDETMVCNILDTLGYL